MEIRIAFKGGPLDGDQAMVEFQSLDPYLAFINEQDRTVHVYARENETLYFYDPLKSRRSTESFEESKDRLEQTIQPIIRFLPLPDFG